MSLRHVFVLAGLLVVLVPMATLGLGIGVGHGNVLSYTSAAPVVGAGDLTRGGRLYTANCAGCHAAEARLAPSHASPEFRARYPTDDGIAVVVRSGRHPMPRFGPLQLSDQDLADIIAYTRSLRP